MMGGLDIGSLAHIILPLSGPITIVMQTALGTGAVLRRSFGAVFIWTRRKSADP
jgi:hypothetical protein